MRVLYTLNGRLPQCGQVNELYEYTERYAPTRRNNATVAAITYSRNGGGKKRRPSKQMASEP
jgi:hypothetical protein